MNTAFSSYDNLVKMNFTEHNLIAMHAELAAFCEPMHKLILVREIAASHRLDQMHHLRLLKTVAA